MANEHVFMLKVLDDIGFDDVGNTIVQWAVAGIFNTENKATKALHTIEKLHGCQYDEAEYLIEKYSINKIQLEDFN